jgi:hypothetical protein
MLKVHLPIESLSWNFYVYGITEDQSGEPSLKDAAGAARAEFVLATAELGLGVFARPYTRPKFAGDLSIGLGDFDLYGEMAVVDGRDNDRVWFNPNADLSPFVAAFLQPPLDLTVLPQAVDAIYPVYRVSGYRKQVVAGISYTVSYNDNDLFTIGAEYFYNGFGYVNSDAYSGLILPHINNLNNPARLFYLGQHYAALYLLLPAPFSLDLHSFTLSTMGNISDRSFITRLDYSFTLLTHLRFELFGAVHYGRRTGEFCLGIQPPIVSGYNLGALLPGQAPILFDVGLALRLSI